MRPTRPSARACGFTLIEMIVAIVAVGIGLAATILFASPLRQAVDTTARAALTDTADNALQRIAREVRLALPNSIRVRTGASGASFIEFIPVRTAGRDRAESSGAGGNGGSDELAFDASDNCFKTIDSLPDAASVTAQDLLVFNNYGEGFDGQNAYATSGTLNRRPVSSIADVGARQRIIFDDLGTPLQRTLHDSPARRFFIVPGDAAGTLPAPVSYECAPPVLRRWSGYAMSTAQPETFAGTSALLADNVASCAFDYQPSGVGPRIGLLTLQITLRRALSDGTSESVTLYHAVHVNNVP
jgi:MSHA biogenesis protein MshO